MFFIKYFILVIIVAFIFAKLEIQIEGENGWAGKLPTWRFFPKIFNKIPGFKKPLTGYHYYLWLLLFIYPHFLFVLIPWSLGIELILLSYVFLVLRLEDFLWFVLNPKYGIKNFCKGKIPWHKDWIGPIPIQYIYSLIVWTILFYLGVHLNNLLK